MSDVTIPADVARRIAAVLRTHVDTVPTGSAAATQWGALADLLDPPPRSLRDEVAEAIAGSYRNDGAWKIKWQEHADAVLAVVRRHVEALPASVIVPDAEYLYRDEVLRLLGGNDD